MAILTPPKPPKNETLQIRVEERIKANLHKYAEFIGSSESYVVSEAFNLLFRKDTEFKSWFEEHPGDKFEPHRKGNSAIATASKTSVPSGPV